MTVYEFLEMEQLVAEIVNLGKSVAVLKNKIELNNGKDDSTIKARVADCTAELKSVSYTHLTLPTKA